MIRQAINSRPESMLFSPKSIVWGPELLLSSRESIVSQRESMLSVPEVIVSAPELMLWNRESIASSPEPYFTPSSSTSKIKVAFGGITPPAPRAP